VDDFGEWGGKFFLKDEWDRTFFIPTAKKVSMRAAIAQTKSISWKGYFDEQEG